MNRKVPQKLNRFNFFQVIAGSLRLSQTSSDLYFHIKFEGAGDRSQAVAGSFTVIWKPSLMLTSRGHDEFSTSWAKKYQTCWISDSALREAKNSVTLKPTRPAMCWSKGHEYLFTQGIVLVCCRLKMPSVIVLPVPMSVEYWFAMARFMCKTWNITPRFYR